MAYIVIKTIKGRRYLYQQRTYRERGRVRTESRYLGPVGAAPALLGQPHRRAGERECWRKLGEMIAANTLTPEERAQVVDEDALLREVKARDAARAQARSEFEVRTGMKLGPSTPTPIDKPASTIDYGRSTPSATTVAAPTADTTVTDGQTSRRPRR